MAMSNIPVLELKGVSKNFVGVSALKDVSLKVNEGEVLCLLGDNGAGKSTLIKVLSGVHQPTSGQLLVNGEPHTFAGPHEALRAGIATVHQIGGTVPLMSVGRNFFLGEEPTKGRGMFRHFDRRTAETVALNELRSLGITNVTDGSALVGGMSGGERQALSIARAMYFGAKVLILDEPTAALGVKEASKVLHLVVRAQMRGVAVVFVTHNVHHALAVGDHFAVLIRGTMTDEWSKGARTREQVLDLMAGGEAMGDLEEELREIRSTGSVLLGKVENNHVS
ncbi:MAG: ATP-binding cassette domain-containing protein [Acidimicrobiales bacterium]